MSFRVKKARFSEKLIYTTLQYLDSHTQNYIEQTWNMSKHPLKRVNSFYYFISMLNPYLTGVMNDLRYDIRAILLFLIYCNSNMNKNEPKGIERRSWKLCEHKSNILKRVFKELLIKLYFHFKYRYFLENSLILKNFITQFSRLNQGRRYKVDGGTFPPKLGW